MDGLPVTVLFFKYLFGFDSAGSLLLLVSQFYEQELLSSCSV